MYKPFLREGLRPKAAGSVARSMLGAEHELSAGDEDSGSMHSPAVEPPPKPVRAPLARLLAAVFSKLQQERATTWAGRARARVLHRKATEAAERAGVVTEVRHIDDTSAIKYVYTATSASKRPPFSL